MSLRSVSRYEAERVIFEKLGLIYDDLARFNVSSRDVFRFAEFSPEERKLWKVCYETRRLCDLPFWMVTAFEKSAIFCMERAAVYDVMLHENDKDENFFDPL